MAISFPVTPPSLPSHSTVRWYEENTVGVSESPITKIQDIYEWDAQRWRLQVSIDPLTREEAAPWCAFLSSLRGRVGTFRYGDILMASPLGIGGGTPKVKGASQVGYELDVDGFPNSQLVLKANDRFQIGDRLYKNLTDATTNGSGEVTLNVWPILRSPADNADLILSSPKGLFRLTDNVIYPDDLDRNRNWNISFEAQEAL